MAEIAAEKAGIIKPTRKVIGQSPEAATPLLRAWLSTRERCRRPERVPSSVVDRQVAIGGEADQPVRSKGRYDEISPLYGAHQAQNAAVAIRN